MKVLKWIAIVAGVVLVLFLIAVGIGIYWFSTIEGVKMSASDFEVGGSYSAEDRVALVSSCEKTSGESASAKEACTCIADKAGSEFSRYDRLLLVASFESDMMRVLALSKGASDSGIPSDKIPDEKHFEALFKSCGLGEP